ncbi:rhamnulokinase [bacterium]|nr:rhamnulokinase [bacterium]
MSTSQYLAFDIGAESGRAILGALADGQLTIQQISRFANGTLEVNGHLHWNIYRLFEEIKNALQACAAQHTDKPASIAIDTWAVDFGLVGREGDILGLPFAYRDHRTAGMMEEMFKMVPQGRLYQLTGIQMLPFNTIFQLLAMARNRSSLLQIAQHLLFIPDLLSYLLTGEKKSEFTLATTSQLYNSLKHDWEKELLKAIGVSRALMPEVVAPATRLGVLLPVIVRETGMQQVPVVACASHDTGSAVAAVPAQGQDWAYLSSGTWSLMGVEVHAPVITAQTQQLNFTNEGGVSGTFRLLKNIMGLWLVQQCRRAWLAQRQYTYEELMQLAASAAPGKAWIDPDSPEFLNPPDMPAAVQAYCLRTGQVVPQSHAQIIRCVYESLALKYRLVLEQLKQVHSQKISRLHIVGGGANNTLLCQWTANATGLPVFAGPTEATAIGNIMVQALASGQVQSLAEIRGVVATSFPPVHFEPQEQEAWNEAFVRFHKLVQ